MTGVPSENSIRLGSRVVASRTPSGLPPLCRQWLPRYIVLHRPRRWIVLERPMTAKRRFQLVLIKPSHYDDDGYVIRWWRAMIPSNSLAAVYGIAADCAERQVLGPNIPIPIQVIAETHTRTHAPPLPPPPPSP